MRMQEPEQWQQARQEGQEDSDLGAAYSGRYDPEAQQEYIEVVAGDDYQEQKIYPQEQVSSRKTARSTIAQSHRRIALLLPPVVSGHYRVPTNLRENSALSPQSLRC